MVLKPSPEMVTLMPPVPGALAPKDVTTGESKLNRVLAVPIFLETKPTRFKACPTPRSTEHLVDVSELQYTFPHMVRPIWMLGVWKEDPPRLRPMIVRLSELGFPAPETARFCGLRAVGTGGSYEKRSCLHPTRAPSVTTPL